MVLVTAGHRFLALLGVSAVYRSRFVLRQWRCWLLDQGQPTTAAGRLAPSSNHRDAIRALSNRLPARDRDELRRIDLPRPIIWVFDVKKPLIVGAHRAQPPRIMR